MRRSSGLIAVLVLLFGAVAHGVMNSEAVDVVRMTNRPPVPFALDEVRVRGLGVGGQCGDDVLIGWCGWSLDQRLEVSGETS